MTDAGQPMTARFALDARHDAKVCRAGRTSETEPIDTPLALPGGGSCRAARAGELGRLRSAAAHGRLPVA